MTPTTCRGIPKTTIRLPTGARPTLRSSGHGTVRSSFEPGDDVLVEISTVSGTVRLVPG